MASEPPFTFLDELDAKDRQTVTQWWRDLLPSQRLAIQILVDAPECTMHLVDRDSPESDSTVNLFADDWSSTWEECWESDWREYLTEHPDVRVATLDFMCLMVRYGD